MGVVPFLRGAAASDGAYRRGHGPTLVVIAHSRQHIPDVLRDLLTAAGYDIVAAPVDRSLVERLIEVAAEVVVVDGSRDDFDMMRLCRDLRRSVASRIVVVPPSGADETWTMEAFRAGADDVLAPDASDAMISTRMMALVRRGPPRERRAGRLVVGDVVVDVDGHSVVIAGDVVRFPVRLFRMLVELARRPNAVVTCEQLLRDVWGVDHRPAHRRRLRVAVSSLRRLLGHGAQRPRIETVVRVGYRLTTATAALH